MQPDCRTMLSVAQKVGSLFSSAAAVTASRWVKARNVIGPT